MRINKIDNTNFGMALKINPKLTSEIEKKGHKFLSELDTYGEKISDVKLYNVVFDNNLQKPKIFHHDNAERDFFQELKNEEVNLGKWYEVPAGFHGERRGGFFPDEPRTFMKLYGEKAKEKYADFKKLNIKDQAAEYSRMLETLEIRRMIAKEKEKSEKLIKEIEESDARKKISKAAEDLVEKYKYEEPVADTTVNNESNKSWWRRIFG